MVSNINANLLFQLYQQDSAKKNTNGIISQEDFFKNSAFTVNGDTVTITEDDGDIFTYNVNELTGATNNQSTTKLTAAEAAARSNVVPVNPGDDVSKTMVTSTNRSKEEIQKDLDEVQKQQKEIKEQMAENSNQIRALQEENEQLYEEINQKVSEYIEKAENISEDKKAEVEKLTLQEIAKYKSGEYKSKEELHAAIQAGVADIMSEEAINGLLSELDSSIDGVQSKIDANLAEITRLETENASLQETLDQLNIQEVKLQQELKLAEKCEKPDPQGFTVENEDGSTTQYDFFVDKDGNKDLTDASEFLGASGTDKESCWAEMTALDTNDDGVVDANELDAGNVMVMVTTVDASGNKTQKAVSAKEAFGENSDLAISTEQNNTTSGSDTPMNFNNDSRNELLGNFNVSLNGQNYTGYQTADTYDFLNSNYNFTSGSAEGLTTSLNLSSSSAATAAALDNVENNKFAYDTDSLLNSVKAEDDCDLLKYAEDICAKNGINFNGKNVNSTSEAEEGKEIEDFYDFEQELELDFAA